MVERSFEDALAAARDPSRRWPKRGGANRLEPECWPAIQPRFSFRRGDGIFTIGSCFARNIEKHLDDLGLELPGYRLARDRPEESLNKFTPPSILQELRWTKAILDRDDQVGAADIERFLLPLSSGKVVDLQKHSVEPGGATPEHALEVRRARYAVFRNAFLCKVSIITLGHIECWWDTHSGDAVELSGVFMGAPKRFVFRRLSFGEAFEQVAATLDLLAEGASTNVLLTTSPVPLARTFTDDDVIVANTYSKSMLRTISGQLAEERPHVDYFPSYESVTLTRQSEVWLNDLIHVSPQFVSRIMGRVVESYIGEAHDAVTDRVLAFGTLVADRNWPEAQAMYAGLEDADPASATLRARFHLDAAEMMIHAARREDAARHVDRLIAPRSDLNANDLLRLARVAEALGRRGRAEKIRAAGLPAPESVNIVHVRVNYLHDAGRSDDARLVLDSGASTFAEDPDALLVIGDNYLALGLKDQARSAYRDASALAPDDWRPKAKLRWMDAA